MGNNQSVPSTPSTPSTTQYTPLPIYPTLDKSDDVSKNKSEHESMGVIIAQIEGIDIRLGQTVHATDADGACYGAIIMGAKNNKLRVHFVGWSVVCDEWIPYDKVSKRIRFLPVEFTKWHHSIQKVGAVVSFKYQESMDPSLAIVTKINLEHNSCVIRFKNPIAFDHPEIGLMFFLSMWISFADMRVSRNCTKQCNEMNIQSLPHIEPRNPYGEHLKVNPVNISSDVESEVIHWIQSSLIYRRALNISFPFSSTSLTSSIATQLPSMNEIIKSVINGEMTGSEIAKFGDILRSAHHRSQCADKPLLTDDEKVNLFVTSLKECQPQKLQNVLELLSHLEINISNNPIIIHPSDSKTSTPTIQIKFTEEHILKLIEAMSIAFQNQNLQCLSLATQFCPELHNHLDLLGLLILKPAMTQKKYQMLELVFNIPGVLERVMSSPSTTTLPIVTSPITPSTCIPSSPPP